MRREAIDGFEPVDDMRKLAFAYRQAEDGLRIMIGMCTMDFDCASSETEADEALSRVHALHDAIDELKPDFLKSAQELLDMHS